jgi:5,10-methylenetetrahydromethanopterin reductase
MVFSTPDSAHKAREHLGAGAARGGRRLDEIEIGSLVPVALAAERTAAYDQMRPVLAFYLGFFPRYRRVAREAGFGSAVDAAAEAYKLGGIEAARLTVSDEMVATLTAAGTASDVRAKIGKYRRAGIALPIIMPVATAVDTAASIETVIRGCGA